MRSRGPIDEIRRTIPGPIKVLDMQPEGESDIYFLLLAQTLGLDYRFLECGPPRTLGDLEIDISKLDDAVRQLLGSGGSPSSPLH